MTLELYKEVSLTADVSDHDLKSGDIATLIDILPHPTGGEDGCILEVFNAIGESISVITVPKSSVQPLKGDEIFSVRSFAQAS